MTTDELDRHRAKAESLKALREELAVAVQSYGSSPSGAGSPVKTSAPTGNPAVEKAVDRKIELESRITAMQTDLDAEWASWEPLMEERLSPEEQLTVSYYYHYAKPVRWLVHRRQRKHGGEWKTCMNTVYQTRMRALKKLQ